MKLVHRMNRGPSLSMYRPRTELATICANPVTVNAKPAKRAMCSAPCPTICCTNTDRIGAVAMVVKAKIKEPTEM